MLFRSLVDRIGRSEDRGAAAEKERKEADEVRALKGAVEEKIAVLREVGDPGFTIVPPDDLLLATIIRPNHQQERSLRQIVQTQPSLVEGRLMLAHIEAELAELQKRKQAGESGREFTERLARTQAQRDDVVAKYRRLFLGIRQTHVDAILALNAEMEKLQPRVDRDRERGRQGRNDQELSRLDRKSVV